MLDRKTAQELWDFTVANMPKVRESAREAFARGMNVEDLIGMIVDEHSSPLRPAAQVVTRREFGFPKVLEVMRGHGGEARAMAEKLARRDPNTLYVFTFYRGSKLLTDIPVTTVYEVTTPPR